MLRKAVSTLFVLSTLAAALPGVTLAQATDPKREKKAREVREKIQRLGTGQSAVVKVKLYNDTEYKGYISRANDNDFEIIDTTRVSHAVPYADVKSIGGKNMSTGAKVAIGVGIGAGVTLLVLVLIFNHITQNN